MIYECDQCGACCRAWIVEADFVDVLREPRIGAECKRLDGRGTIDLLDAKWSIGICKTEPCPFLADNKCGIHATKPHECVAVVAGDPKCHQARELEKLPPLEPVDREPADEPERIRVAIVEHYASGGEFE